MLARGLLAALLLALVAAPRAHAYGWPIAPFTRQHPIRGSFGDPRMRSPEPYNADRVPTAGTFAFHNGIDIVAAGGTPVYPVAAGTVRTLNPAKVVVESRGRRLFQYRHIKPLVRVGNHVVARRTVLGTVLAKAEHVHLTEIDRGRVVNPLFPGHLAPYHDTTQPHITAFRVRDPAGNRLDLGAISGSVSLEADAFDPPQMPVPGPWNGLPVTPAQITWSLAASTGVVAVGPAVAVDFRRTIPSNNTFWRTYGPGTFQSRPRYGGGRYVFRLTHGLLDTRRLTDGFYVLEVTAVDIRGNRATATAQVRICNACVSAPRLRSSTGLSPPAGRRLPTRTSIFG